ncbi:uncharacterized protein LOC130441427 [Diorhabda sublineata]|uniref:uncharacterized protein LOC130441427 n=1 Tax=Diorhabda sublineata TaxID=1163346 RepID=UPI0024E0C231|nr:uncharacterized protein LOC130441427 [Diorhabda sublineata]XP_056631092.1 uncharacterized protein LOC130441427 [Diorhabda sublineata]
MQSVHKSIDTKSRKICSVPQCSSYCTKDISLHAFPLDPKLNKAWKTVLKIGKPVTKYMLVCSHHFTKSDFTMTTSKRRRLKKHIIPSKKIPQPSHPTTKTAINRTDQHWLQKCACVSKEQMEIESEGSLQPDDNVDMGKGPAIISKSDKGVIVSHVGTISTDFTEDKATQTEFYDFFQLSQI